MTYELIKKANDTIRTTNIKGKEYAEVPQRIKAFRMVYPDGSIQTEIVNLADGVCTMKAIILNDNGEIIGTGHAQEKESGSFINKTSYIENCETSAVGRALGMCGFGIDTSVASAEEVINAISNQDQVKCEICGEVITPVRKSNGEIWTVEQIVAFGKADEDGKAKCAKCARAAIKQRLAAQKNDGNA